MSTPDRMRLLWIATKPPLPTVDGGRLAAAETLRALTSAGADVDLVAPLLPSAPSPTVEDLARMCRPHLVPVRPPRLAATVLRTVQTPLSIARHCHPPLRDRVAELLSTETFDLVHVEQVQAFAQAAPAYDCKLPVVVRAQNVESDLWRVLAPWAPWEARRLAAYERRVIRRATATIALSSRDASRLRELAGNNLRIVAIPPPFPATLPASGRTLDGEPPLVLMGSAGWPPNRDASQWFVDRCWPEVLARVPGVVLHVFAPERDRPRLPDRVVGHAPPVDSAEAFPIGSILVVPLRVGSGIRMKVLEAWARSVPVVATPEAVAGLAAQDGEEVLLAHGAAEFADAIRRLSTHAGLRRRLVAAGHRALSQHHDPRTVADRLLSVYVSVAG